MANGLTDLGGQIFARVRTCDVLIYIISTRIWSGGDILLENPTSYFYKAQPCVGIRH